MGNKREGGWEMVGFFSETGKEKGVTDIFVFFEGGRGGFTRWRKNPGGFTACMGGKVFSLLDVRYAGSLSIYATTKKPLGGGGFKKRSRGSISHRTRGNPRPDILPFLVGETLIFFWTAGSRWGTPRCLSLDQRRCFIFFF